MIMMTVMRHNLHVGHGSRLCERCVMGNLDRLREAIAGPTVHIKSSDCILSTSPFDLLKIHQFVMLISKLFSFGHLALLPPIRATWWSLFGRQKQCFARMTGIE